MQKEQRNVAQRLVRWAIRHRVTVTMGFLALITLGLISYLKIPIQFMPSGFDPPFMGVFISYPNSNAYEVDEKIADPLVAQLRTVRGLKEISSRSNAAGCWIFLRFQGNVEMDAAYLEVRNRIERIRPDLPEGVDRYRIWRYNPDAREMMSIVVSPPTSLLNAYHLIEERIANPIQRLSGVGRVVINGLAEPEVLVELDQDAIERHHVNLISLIQRLRRENFSMVSGHIDEGSRRYYIRSVGKWRSLDEIANLEINNRGLKLKDIASIRIGPPDPTGYFLVNDRDGVVIDIFKESTASSVVVSRAIRKWLRELQARDPEIRDWKIETLFDEGREIEESLRNLQIAGLYGGILAALVLFFFIRNVKLTLAIALAMPMSLTMTLIAMYFSGETLNLVSMMGLMLAVGMVVDNAVVVVESIDRYRHLGMKPRDASYYGASEVGLAVLTATATTLAVFLPLILLNNDMGFAFYMARLGFPVCIALVASLTVALIFIPVGSIHLAPTRGVTNRIVERVRAGYRKSLRTVLSARWSRALAMLVIAVLFISMFYPMNRVRRTDLRHRGRGDFGVFMDIPSNFTLDQAREAALKVIRTLLSHKDELYLRILYTNVRTTFARVRVYLQDPKTRPLDREEIVERTRALLPEQPGIRYRFGWTDTGGASTMPLTLYGRDVQKLEAILQDLAPQLERIPGVIGVDIPTDLKTQELHIQVQDWIGQRMGVNPFLLAQNLAFAVRGLNIRSAFPLGNDYLNLKIIYQKEDREDLSRILDFKIPTATGSRLPIRSVAALSFHQGIGQIERNGGRISLRFTLNLKSDVDMFMLYGWVRRIMDRYPWPPDYGWEMGSRFREFRQSQQTQTFAVMVAIVLVFLLMGTLFESVILPFCVIFSIPFAFVGVYWLLFATNTTLDIMAGIGLILLIGIVVNNAIVLIDRVNQLRHEGLELIEAIVEGATQRFRPIWMTALTTIGGMLPMALGQGDLAGISYAPLARAVIGGLLTSTFVTLVIVPLIYYFSITWQARTLALLRNLGSRHVLPRWLRSEP